MAKGYVLHIARVELAICTRSCTLNGLKITRNIPLMMLENADCEAKPTMAANTPAPVSKVLP
jgi:hypothetical protein